VGERWRRPFAGELPAFVFAIGWLAAAYALFVLLVPSASYWSKRLQLTVAVPGLLLTTVVLTVAARALSPGRSERTASAAMMVLLILAGQVHLPLSEPARPTDEYNLFRLARSWRLAPGARVFATPNQHLVLTYYTGLPVQSVSAVRRDWFDAFPGDLVIVDTQS
jgi:hypothetical protein